MSEMVGYYIMANGFKDKKEKEEYIELAKDFQGAEVREDNNNNVIAEVLNGWRGGGLSCKEILQEHFGEWLREHPHILFHAEVSYLEHCPIEKFDGDEIKEGGND